jgi:lactoylglutathione lyase
MDALLKRMDVVVFFVADLARSTAFYRDVIGLSVDATDDSSAVLNLDNAMIILLTLPAARDLLTAQHVADPGARGVKSQIASFVEDVDAVYATLSGRGVEFIKTPADQPWGMRTASFADPDGNVWELTRELSGTGGAGS